MSATRRAPIGSLGGGWRPNCLPTSRYPPWSRTCTPPPPIGYDSYIDFCVDFYVDFRIGFLVDYYIDFRVDFLVDFNIDFRVDFRPPAGQEGTKRLPGGRYQVAVPRGASRISRPR